MIKIQKLEDRCVRIENYIYPLNSLIIETSGKYIRIITMSAHEVIGFTDHEQFAVAGETPEATAQQISAQIYG